MLSIELAEIPMTLSSDNRTLTIYPKAILKNSKYRIRISGLKKKSDSTSLSDVDITVRTPYSPLYCTVDSLRLLVDTFDIPEENMLSFIRTASKEADFIAGGSVTLTNGSPPFEVEEFVRTKAVIDCILRGYMGRAYTGGGSKYQLDMATYEDSLNANAFKDILGNLKNALKKWQDAIRGYYNEGRVKPKATRIGLKSSQNSDVSYTSLDTIIQDITRNVPQWS